MPANGSSPPGRQAHLESTRASGRRDRGPDARRPWTTPEDHDRGKHGSPFAWPPVTYEYIHDNPAVEFKTSTIQTSPVIARQDNMGPSKPPWRSTDGAVTAESIGENSTAASGAGRLQAGASMARNGKTILAPSHRLAEMISRSYRTCGRVQSHPHPGGRSVTSTEFASPISTRTPRGPWNSSHRHPKFRARLMESERPPRIRDQAYIPGERGM